VLMVYERDVYRVGCGVWDGVRVESLMGCVLGGRGGGGGGGGGSGTTKYVGVSSGRSVFEHTSPREHKHSGS